MFCFGFYSGFTSGEYHVIRVDFIVALRRTKGRGRRTLRSPPSPSSGLHLIHPGLSAAAGHYCCRGFGAILESGIRCRSIIASSEFGFAFCVRAWTVRVSVYFVGFVSFVFHYWGDGLFVPATTWCFAMNIRRICANRDWVVCFCG